jgi:hypothetical protein
MYWRSPVYVFMRLGLPVFYVCHTLSSNRVDLTDTEFQALFLGFSFYRDLKYLEDLQNQMFGVFMLL